MHPHTHNLFGILWKRNSRENRLIHRDLEVSGADPESAESPTVDTSEEAAKRVDALSDRFESDEQREAALLKYTSTESREPIKYNINREENDKRYVLLAGQFMDEFGRWNGKADATGEKFRKGAIASKDIIEEEGRKLWKMDEAGNKLRILELAKTRTDTLHAAGDTILAETTALLRDGKDVPQAHKDLIKAIFHAIKKEGDYLKNKGYAIEPEYKARYARLHDLYYKWYQIYEALFDSEGKEYVVEEALTWEDLEQAKKEYDRALNTGSMRWYERKVKSVTYHAKRNGGYVDLCALGLTQEDFVLAGLAQAPQTYPVSTVGGKIPHSAYNAQARHVGAGNTFEYAPGGQSKMVPARQARNILKRISGARKRAGRTKLAEAKKKYEEVKRKVENRYGETWAEVQQRNQSRKSEWISAKVDRGRAILRNIHARRAYEKSASKEHPPLAGPELMREFEYGPGRRSVIISVPEAVFEYTRGHNFDSLQQARVRADTRRPRSIMIDLNPSMKPFRRYYAGQRQGTMTLRPGERIGRSNQMPDERYANQLGIRVEKNRERVKVYIPKWLENLGVRIEGEEIGAIDGPRNPYAGGPRQERLPYDPDNYDRYRPDEPTPVARYNPRTVERTPQYLTFHQFARGLDVTLRGRQLPFYIDVKRNGGKIFVLRQMTMGEGDAARTFTEVFRFASDPRSPRLIYEPKYDNEKAFPMARSMERIDQLADFVCKARVGKMKELPKGPTEAEKTAVRLEKALEGDAVVTQTAVEQLTEATLSFIPLREAEQPYDVFHMLYRVYFLIQKKIREGKVASGVDVQKATDAIRNLSTLYERQYGSPLTLRPAPSKAAKAPAAAPAAVAGAPERKERVAFGAYVTSLRAALEEAGFDPTEVRVDPYKDRFQIFLLGSRQTIVCRDIRLVAGKPAGDFIFPDKPGEPATMEFNGGTTRYILAYVKFHLAPATSAAKSAPPSPAGKPGLKKAAEEGKLKPGGVAEALKPIDYSFLDKYPEPDADEVRRVVQARIDSMDTPDETAKLNKASYTEFLKSALSSGTISVSELYAAAAFLLDVEGERSIGKHMGDERTYRDLGVLILTKVRDGKVHYGPEKDDAARAHRAVGIIRNTIQILHRFRSGPSKKPDEAPDKPAETVKEYAQEYLKGLNLPTTIEAGEELRVRKPEGDLRIGISRDVKSGMAPDGTIKDQFGQELGTYREEGDEIIFTISYHLSDYSIYVYPGSSEMTWLAEHRFSVEESTKPIDYSFLDAFPDADKDHVLRNAQRHLGALDPTDWNTEFYQESLPAVFDAAFTAGRLENWQVSAMQSYLLAALSDVSETELKEDPRVFRDLALQIVRKIQRGEVEFPNDSKAGQVVSMFKYLVDKYHKVYLNLRARGLIERDDPKKAPDTPMSATDKRIHEFFGGGDEVEVKDGVVRLPDINKNIVGDKIPEGVTEIHGNIALTNGKHDVLPSTLRKIVGLFDYGYTNIVPSLPENLVVEGDLIFDNNTVPVSNVRDLRAHSILAELKDKNVQVSGNISFRNLSYGWFNRLRTIFGSLAPKMKRVGMNDGPDAVSTRYAKLETAHDRDPAETTSAMRDFVSLLADAKESGTKASPDWKHMAIKTLTWATEIGEVKFVLDVPHLFDHLSFTDVRYTHKRAIVEAITESGEHDHPMNVFKILADSCQDPLWKQFFERASFDYVARMKLPEKAGKQTIASNALQHILNFDLDKNRDEKEDWDDILQDHIQSREDALHHMVDLVMESDMDASAKRKLLRDFREYDDYTDRKLRELSGEPKLAPKPDVAKMVPGESMEMERGDVLQLGTKAFDVVLKSEGDKGVLSLGGKWNRVVEIRMKQDKGLPGNIIEGDGFNWALQDRLEKKEFRSENLGDVTVEKRITDGVYLFKDSDGKVQAEFHVDKPNKGRVTATLIAGNMMMQWEMKHDSLDYYEEQYEREIAEEGEEVTFPHRERPELPPSGGREPHLIQELKEQGLTCRVLGEIDAYGFYTFYEITRRDGQRVYLSSSGPDDLVCTHYIYENRNKQGRYVPLFNDASIVNKVSAVMNRSSIFEDAKNTSDKRSPEYQKLLREVQSFDSLLLEAVKNLEPREGYASRLWEFNVETFLESSDTEKQALLNQAIPACRAYVTAVNAFLSRPEVKTAIESGKRRGMTWQIVKINGEDFAMQKIYRLRERSRNIGRTLVMLEGLQAIDTLRNGLTASLVEAPASLETGAVFWEKTSASDVYDVTRRTEKGYESIGRIRLQADKNEPIVLEITDPPSVKTYTTMEELRDALGVSEESPVRLSDYERRTGDKVFDQPSLIPGENWNIRSMYRPSEIPGRADTLKLYDGPDGTLVETVPASHDDTYALLEIDDDGWCRVQRLSDTGEPLGKPMWVTERDEKYRSIADTHHQLIERGNLEFFTETVRPLLERIKGLSAEDRKGDTMGDALVTLQIAYLKLMGATRFNTGTNETLARYIGKKGADVPDVLWQIIDDIARMDQQEYRAWWNMLDAHVGYIQNVLDGDTQEPTIVNGGKTMYSVMVL